jgi:small conductance mechanosensitive channel
MTSARPVVYRVLGLAVVLVLLGSSLASAQATAAPAQADAGTVTSAPAPGGIGTGPITLSSAHEVMTRLYEYLAQYGLKIVGAILILLVGRWVAKLVSALLGRALAKAKVDPTLVPFIDNLAYTGLLIFVVIAALAELGVQTASVVAVLGAAGLAVGLALQGSLANFASGVLLLVFKPFRVGDFVEIAGVKGTVQVIHVFNTVLNSPDNVRIIVPNASVTGSSILNYTINGTRRIDLVISVSYSDDLRKARRVVENVLATEARLLPEPAPVVAVSEMAASSINLVVRPWVKVADYWDVYFALTERLKVALEENGLTIPFPQQDIYIKSVAATAASAAIKSA